jgi:hypothetical protein
MSFLCNISFVDLLFLSTFFGGDVRREFTQRLSLALNGTLGSYLRDALQEGSAYDVTRLHVPQAYVCEVFPSFLLLAWYSPLLFLVNMFWTYSAELS